VYEEMPTREDLLERARECLAHRSKSWVVDATLFARFLLRELDRPLLTHVAVDFDPHPNLPPPMDGERSTLASAVFSLQDNRVLSIPLAWMPALATADRLQLEHWQLVDRGEGIRWPMLQAPELTFYEISLGMVLQLWDRVKEGI
jgi:hypothetical protein